MAKEANLIFRTGFEADTVGSPEDAHIEITGVDRSVEPPNDWERHLKGHRKLGGFRIQYQGGEPEDRHARIIDDPTAEGNRVLWYWLRNPRTPAGDGFKGRIQANIYDNTDLTAVCKRVRMYLHPDLEIMKTTEDAIRWFTIEELWFDPFWPGGKFPFRINLNVAKDEGAGQGLHFYVYGQQWDFDAELWQPTIWDQHNRSFHVSIGEWLQIETRYRMGNASSGRLQFAVTTGDGARHDIFDITNWTYSPIAPHPIPMTHWNPLKLYTSSKTVELIRDKGGVAQIYWDDLEIWDGWPEDKSATDQSR